MKVKALTTKGKIVEGEIYQVVVNYHDTYELLTEGKYSASDFEIIPDKTDVVTVSPRQMRTALLMNGITTAENTSTAFNLLRGGGGGGGTVVTTFATSAGGSGARYYNKAGTLSGANNGAVNTDGGDGADGHMNRLPFNLGDGNYSGITIGYGCPGGGGGSSVAPTNAGRGGDGGDYGGAGGGGGCCNGAACTSGRGGNGGAGVVIVIEHIVS